MRESEAVEKARRALGAKLAAYRRAAGYSQAELAALVGYSRSTVANVEVGRQHVPRDFWKNADEAVHADGGLTGVNDEIEAAVMRERKVAAQAMQLFPVALADVGGADGWQLVRFPGGALNSTDQIAWPAGHRRPSSRRRHVSMPRSSP